MITIHDVAHEYMKSCNIDTEDTLRRLLLKALSPLQRMAYDFLLRNFPFYISTGDVAEHLGKSVSHASNILNLLFDVCLVRKDIGIDGKRMYKVFYHLEDILDRHKGEIE